MLDELNFSVNNQWLQTLNKLVKYGQVVSPRGLKTIEIPHHTVTIDAIRPVLTVPERALSYQFMAAEAFWILSGDERVSAIAPFNKNIAQFSDDGEVFAGAYGPRIAEQLDYVVDKLAEDDLTRQAGLTIWRPNPTKSKDIPCTVAIWFQIRDQQLNGHVFMRSSDVWLGLPYDLFNFSMLLHLVCGLYRQKTGHLYLQPGRLHLTAASCHLYEGQVPQVDALLGNRIYDMADWPIQHRVPDDLHKSPAELLQVLQLLRHTKRGDKLRWWED